MAHFPVKADPCVHSLASRIRHSGFIISGGAYSSCEPAEEEVIERSP